MEKLSKYQRVLRALNREEVDRTPFGLWRHFPNIDQNPKKLAEREASFAKKFDTDIMKLNPSGLYTVQDKGTQIKYFNNNKKVPKIKNYSVNDPKDWEKLEVQKVDEGSYKDRIETIMTLKDHVEDNRPMIETVFSPLTTAKKLSGKRFTKDLKNNPSLVHTALEKLTLETIKYIQALSKMDIAGIFYATQCATTDLLSKSEHQTFGKKYDIEVLEKAEGLFEFTVLHAHGRNLITDQLFSYPFDVFSWHAQITEPSLKEVLKDYKFAAMAGVNRETILSGSEDEIIYEVRKAINASRETGGLVLAPGCTISPKVRDRALHLIKNKVQGRGI